MLNGAMRADHETTCEHASLSCPISKSCRWNGSSEAIIGHLEKVHNLKLVKNDHLTVEIANFREKTLNNEGDYGVSKKSSSLLQKKHAEKLCIFTSLR